MKWIIGILIFLINKLITLITYIWLIAATVPLLIGALMIDIVLKIMGVEKTFLMITELARWFETMSVYLKTRNFKPKKDITGEKKEYV